MAQPEVLKDPLLSLENDDAPPKLAVFASRYYST
jgi:hypothetical protein